jgi:ribonuclease BN (tRNA processing enzyme)
MREEGWDVELIVLGASGSWPTAGGATSGYLLRHEGYNLWIDLGTGTLARLQEHVSHAQVHAVLISHSHPDHCVDLHTLFYARFFHPQPLGPLPVFLPSGAFDAITCAVGERTAAAMRETFDVRDVDPGASFEIGPFRLRTRPMRHTVPTLGLRVEADGQALAYTADTAPTKEIEVIGRDSELLLAEATYLQVDRRAPLHLTARQAGGFAARSATARLVLTHIWPTVDPESARSQAMEAFPGEVTLAVEGLRLDLGQERRDD